MTILYQTQINSDDVTTLRNLDFDRSSRAKIITQLIKGGVDVDSDSFTKYHKAYVESEKLFEDCKKRLILANAPMMYIAMGSGFSIDYNSGILSVLGQDENLQDSDNSSNEEIKIVSVGDLPDEDSETSTDK